MFQVAEVIETKKAFKSNQVDEEGNLLPLGSILVKLGAYQNMLGQVRNVWARPVSFNRRMPLIGEHVLLLNGPVHDNTSKNLKTTGYYYFSPLNATDDLAFHHYPKLWERQASSPSNSPGGTLSDQEIPGYTFPKNPSRAQNVQVFEGDVLFEGRWNQSIRFGSTIVGNLSVYEKKPTWLGAKSQSPIMILRVGKAEGGGNVYNVESLDQDKSSIYLTFDQTLPKVKMGFPKNLEAAKVPTYSKAQILIDSEQVVINAKVASAMLIGKTKAIVAANKVQLQSSKYNVDLDDLMDWLLSWAQQHFKLVSGEKQYSTAAGPTATATNLAEMTKIVKADFPLKFKKP